MARELERIAGLLFHAGEVTRLDVEATSAERASLEADLDELDIHLAEAQLALDTLLAAPPGSSAVQLAASTAVPLAESRIAAGQPIDLLRRRPDLIAEAARLDAAELQSLAARRDLFPKLAVQAAVGRSGFALGDAVSSASNFARVGATFGLPLLDYANRGAAIELADAEGGTAYIAFEQALARALEEVERGLTRIAGQQRRHAALSRTRDHRERAHRLAQRSYELGEANLSEVLDAQRGALQRASGHWKAAPHWRPRRWRCTWHWVVAGTPRMVRRSLRISQRPEGSVGDNASRLAHGLLAAGGPSSQNHHPFIQGGSGASSGSPSSAPRMASRRACSASVALISRITASISAASSGSANSPVSSVSGVSLPC